jgi:hypothetical protein
MAVWALVFLGSCKGINFIAKICHFTFALKVLILVSLILYTLTIPGAFKGLTLFADSHYE